MKSAIILATALLAMSAHANTLVCENNKVNPQDETVVLKIDGNTYEVSHYGHSKNSYAAKYVLAGTQTTRYGSISGLKKYQDDSTWKDMPDTITLQDDVASHEWIMTSLTNTGTIYIYFDYTKCRESLN
jgi:hypothetical protein